MKDSLGIELRNIRFSKEYEIPKLRSVGNLSVLILEKGSRLF